MERDERSGLLLPREAARAARARTRMESLIRPEAVERVRRRSGLAPLEHLRAEEPPVERTPKGKRKAGGKKKTPAQPPRPIHKCYALDCDETDALAPLERIAFNENRPGGVLRPLRVWYACKTHYPTWRPPSHIAMMPLVTDWRAVSARPLLQDAPPRPEARPAAGAGPRPKKKKGRR